MLSSRISNTWTCEEKKKPARISNVDVANRFVKMTTKRHQGAEGEEFVVDGSIPDDVEQGIEYVGEELEVNVRVTITDINNN